MRTNNRAFDYAVADGKFKWTPEEARAKNSFGYGSARFDSRHVPFYDSMEFVKELKIKKRPTESQMAMLRVIEPHLPANSPYDIALKAKRAELKANPVANDSTIARMRMNTANKLESMVKVEDTINQVTTLERLHNKHIDLNTVFTGKDAYVNVDALSKIDDNAWTAFVKYNDKRIETAKLRLTNHMERFEQDQAREYANSFYGWFWKRNDLFRDLADLERKQDILGKLSQARKVAPNAPGAVFKIPNILAKPMVLAQQASDLATGLGTRREFLEKMKQIGGTIATP